VLAVVSILVGNVGALMQDSLKRMLGYSGIAQAGYMLVGIVVASELGVNALVFYLAAYTLMNLPAFAVILIRERETALGDHIDAIAGIGRDRPELAWPITISMLALAGLPGTAGFIGKLYLIEAAVDGDFTWLGVAIAVGTMVSLGYYLRVIAAVWMRPAAGREAMPAMAGGSPEADAEGPPATEAPPPGAPRRTRCPMILVPTWIAALATVVLGIVPSPLVDWATDAGESLTTLL
jgi:NADH-quinone oxidoreductase subunit N